MNGIRHRTSSIRLILRSTVSSAHCSGSQQPREEKKANNFRRTLSYSTAARSWLGLRSVRKRSQVSILDDQVRLSSLVSGFSAFCMLPSSVHARNGNGLGKRNGTGIFSDSWVVVLFEGSYVVWPSSRWSQAFANRQSSFTVSGETPRTAAVSSTVRPPKNRSSTTCPCRVWSFASLSSASSSANSSGV